MLKNTENSYGTITKIFHWLMSIMIIGLIIVGFIMSSMESSPEKFQLYYAHKAAGVVILILVILRIIWRLNNKLVQLPTELPLFVKFCAKVTHYLQYVFMLLMPISGVLMSILSGREIPVFGIFTVPALEKNTQLAGIFYQIHVIAIWFFIALIIFHVLAALYHHFIRKDQVLIRMIK
ncbi:MAG: cytochrome b [Rickettsiales bacterium]|nr:MAG: cytochrome b [Rickettsiales bacterium]